MEDVAYNGFGFDANDLKDVVETPFDKRTMIKSLLDSSEFSEVMFDLDDKRAPVFASVSCNGDYGYFIYIPDQPRVMEEEPVKVTPDEAVNLLTKTTASLLLAANQEERLVNDKELAEYLNQYLKPAIEKLVEEQQVIDYI